MNTLNENKNPHYMCVENQNQLTRLKYMTHEIINLSWYWQHFFHTMYIHTDTTHNLTGMTTPMINYRYIADLRQMQMSIVSSITWKPGGALLFITFSPICNGGHPCKKFLILYWWHHNAFLCISIEMTSRFFVSNSL